MNLLTELCECINRFLFSEEGGAAGLNQLATKPFWLVSLLCADNNVLCVDESKMSLEALEARPTGSRNPGGSSLD
jgi:hypothetical protein